MSHSNGIITAPVSLSDIAAVIGDNTDMARSDRINKWSRCKPFRDPSLYFDSDEAREAARKSVFYGLRMPLSTGSVESLATSEIVYERPTAAQKCRALDFKDYAHPESVAGAPLVALGPVNWDTYSANSKTLVWQIRTATQYQLGLNEFLEIANWYPCLVVVKGNTKYMRTMSTTLANSSQISFPLTWGTGGPFGSHADYTYYVCVHDTIQTSWTSTISGEFMALPFQRAALCRDTLHVFSSNVLLNFMATAHTRSGNTNWTITVTSSMPNASAGDVSTIEVHYIRINGTRYELSTKPTISCSGIAAATTTIRSSYFGSVPPIYGDGDIITFDVSDIKLVLAGHSGYYDLPSSKFITQPYYVR